MKKKSTLRAGTRLYLAMLVLTLGLFAIVTFALTIPLNKVLSNVVLSQTMWADVLLILLDLVEILAYAVGAALILFASFRPFSSSAVIRLSILYAATTLLRYIMDVLGAWILYGTRPFFYYYMEPTILSKIPYLILDWLFIVLCVALALTFANRYYRKRAILIRASALLKDEDVPLPELTEFYPFKKAISFKNPLQACTLMLGIVLIIAKIISNLIFDIQRLSWGISLAIGDVISLILSYCATILVGVIFYTVCVLIFHYLFRHQEKFSKE